MQRTVSAQDARQRLGKLLEGVCCRGDEVVIERAGKPMGVVIPMERYRHMQDSRALLRRMWDELKREESDINPAEAERLAVAEIAAYREERRTVAL
jgi:prevent-host-death family protein